MLPLPTPALPSSQIVRREAIDVLIERLGIAKATMFLGETLWQPTDYLQIKQQLFADETVDSLYAKILLWRTSSSTPNAT
jgi:hypothetical protein